MMINVFVISNVDNAMIIKYTFTWNYCFNEIYDEAYDLIRTMCVPGTRILLQSHDSIKQLLYFKLFS